MQKVHYVTNRRRDRIINNDGTVLCLTCNQNKDILEFTRSNGTYAYIEDDDGCATSFGKPYSSCKVCKKAERNGMKDYLRDQEEKRRWAKDVAYHHPELVGKPFEEWWARRQAALGRPIR